MSINNAHPTILAIESSCDDTSAAIISAGEVKSNLIATQEVHRQYGGVIPELASREHHKNIIPVVEEAMKVANINKSDLDAVAFTHGPGLLGSLLVGCSFAKGLAYAQDIPLITVNHMEAHVLAHFVEEPRPPMPFLCLTVSGGHTQLVVVRDVDDMEVVGTTIDDAAGEAFDKVGKYLGLDYPAGPIIDKLAAQGEANIQFPTPKVGGLDFSFSGLKTAIMYYLRDQLKQDETYVDRHMNDICASVQTKIVDILMMRLQQASAKYDITHVGIAGGVSANSALRKTVKSQEEKLGWTTYIPGFQYCTDNAGMIAMAAHYKYLKGHFAELDASPNPRLKI